MLNLLSQLVPYQRCTLYTLDGEVHLALWREWFGRCFAVRDELLGTYGRVI